MNNGIWINRCFIDFYNDSSKKGLRCHYTKISEPIKTKLKKFIKFLNKMYFFPIRCDVYFENSVNILSYNKKNKCKGIFFEGEEDKTTPCIYVPCMVTDSWDIENIYMTIVRLLTFYFQWYFYEDTKRSNRSLEIEATKWAKYIVWNYLNKNYSNKC